MNIPVTKNDGFLVSPDPDPLPVLYAPILVETKTKIIISMLYLCRKIKNHPLWDPTANKLKDLVYSISGNT